jgi:hypothetical protein
VLSPRDAFFGSHRRVDLAHAAGSMAAETLAVHSPSLPNALPVANTRARSTRLTREWPNGSSGVPRSRRRARSACSSGKAAQPGARDHQRHQAVRERAE